MQPAKLRQDGEGAAYIYQKPFIRTGYRKCHTARDCLRSALQWNNETLNIWTHLLGAFLVLGLLTQDVAVRFHECRAQFVDGLLIGSVLCIYATTMLISVAYHTFNCLSESVHGTLLRYDVTAVGVSVGATFASCVYLAFTDHPHLQFIYLSIETLFLVATVPDLQRGPARRLCSMVVFGLVPTVHWLCLSPHVLLLFPRIALLFLCAAASYVVYERKIPECVCPGVVDYVGASHQIWHVMVLVLTMLWHETALGFVRCRMGLCST